MSFPEREYLLTRMGPTIPRMGRAIPTVGIPTNQGGFHHSVLESQDGKCSSHYGNCAGNCFFPTLEIVLRSQCWEFRLGMMEFPCCFP